MAAPERQGITPKEVKVVLMALTMLIEDIETASKDAKMPFTPETRKDFKDMLLTAKLAKAKFEATSGFECVIAPYQEGDEKEFITKPS